MRHLSIKRTTSRPLKQGFGGAQSPPIGRYGLEDYQLSACGRYITPRLQHALSLDAVSRGPRLLAHTADDRVWTDPSS